MSKVLSVRVDDAVAARVEELAAGRSIKSSAWLKEAVASYLGDHERGVPDAPRVVSATRPERVRPVTIPRVNERQAALNDARYGKGNW